jgi:3-phenylpropionate/cinnamic acid dioxygenase small subunit
VGEGDAMSAVESSLGELSELRSHVNSFLMREADLADQHRYDDWLELWSSDGIYWVPCNDDDYDPRQHVSIIYDDYGRLQERCFRLNSPAAHSQDPPSRLCRIIGNEKNVYGARVEYTLQPEGDSFKIRQKKVVLLDNDEPLGNLTFLL